MPQLIISEAARNDLVRLRAFVAEHNQQAAQRAAEILSKAIELIQTHPMVGSSTNDKQIRRLVVPFGANAYITHYTYQEERQLLIVLRIKHSKESSE